MSEVAERASVSLALADFAVADASGKLNILGSGIAGLGFDPGQGVTARFTLVAQIALPGDMCPAEFSVEVTLLDSAGEIADLPGPAGPHKMRIGHVITIEKPALPPGVMGRREDFRGAANVVLDFGNGLPLTPGMQYRWRLQIDGDEASELIYPFGVTGPPATPVMG